MTNLEKFVKETEEKAMDEIKKIIEELDSRIVAGQLILLIQEDEVKKAEVKAKIEDLREDKEIFEGMLNKDTQAMAKYMMKRMKQDPDKFKKAWAEAGEARQEAIEKDGETDGSLIN